LHGRGVEDDQFVGQQWQHGICPSVVVGKLDLKDAGSQKFDNRTNLASHERVIWTIVDQRYGIEEFD
jgi:hypothetical protein